MDKEKKPIYKLDSIIAGMPGYVFWKDKDSIYMGCNLNLANFLGLNSTEEIIGKNDRDFSWSEKLTEKLVADDKRVMFEQIPLTKEYKIKGLDGRTIFLRTDRTPLYNEKKQIIGVLAISVDITCQKRAQKKTKSATKLLEDILYNLPGLIYWKNKKFQYVGFNKNVVTLSGLTREELYGKTDLELNWGEKEAQIFQADDKEIIEVGIMKVMENKLPIKRPDGHSLMVKTEKTRLSDRKGNIKGILGVALDITDKNIVENNLIIAKAKAEIANQAKTEFLQNMRHDIRTPLTGIVGCAQLIQMQQGLPEKVIGFANDLVQSSDALLEFLNKILESIAVASGEIPLLKKKFNLKAALEQIIHLNKPQAVVKKLALTLAYDPAIPRYLIGDAVRVQRVLLELLTNALKYTDKGSIKISARLMKKTARKVIIELRVTDTGMGIPQDKHQEVYNRFTRLTPSFTGVYEGTGLGLSVVKQFIEDLNAEIRIDSELHQGTSFICLIPFQKPLLIDECSNKAALKESDFLPQRAVNETLAPKYVISNQRRILVVEDNAIAVKMAENILSELDCHIDIAMDGKTALEKTAKNHYDLILMDMGLPDANGSEITRYIRLKDGLPNSSVPIIGLTAHIEQGKKQECLSSGMNAVFNKPLTLNKASEILSVFISDQALSPRKLRPAKTTFDLNTIPILDIERALKIIGKKEILMECLDLLIGVLSDDLDVIKRAHKSKDWRMIKNILHKWKGGSSYCGASRLAEACQQLEAILETQPLTLAERSYQQLLEVINATKEAAKEAIAAK